MPGFGRRPRVLIVDDEVGVRMFADRALSEAGCDTRIAADASEALEKVDEGAPFDLAVIDFRLPGMLGDELARRLRRNEPDLKVLYFTGFADSLFEERSTLSANEAFLEKPVTVRALQEAVSLLLFGHTRGLA
jgi:two-component system cell cycle sensor histidine kinase/response regulator CckA